MGAWGVKKDAKDATKINRAWSLVRFAPDSPHKNPERPCGVLREDRQRPRAHTRIRLHIRCVYYTWISYG